MGSKENDSNTPDDGLDEEMWVTAPLPANELNSNMRGFDKALRCEICHGFFQAPVSVVPCQHTFCSECIRNFFKSTMRGLSRSASCPRCRQGVDVGGTDYEKCLVPNRTVEDLVSHYRNVRVDLRNSLCQLETYKSAETSNHQSMDSGENETGPEKRKKRKRSTRSVAKKNYAEDEEIEAKSHRLDAAVTETKISEGPARRNQKLGKTLYKYLKRKQLVELCRKANLSTSGTEKELIARHEEYVTLYNSHSDSFTHQPTPHEIAAEVSRREKARRKESIQARYNGASSYSSHMEKLKESRKAVGEGNGVQVSSGNLAFDAQLETNFAKLIAQGRKRMKSENRNDGQIVANGDALSEIQRDSASESTLTAKLNRSSLKEVQGTGGETSETVLVVAGEIAFAENTKATHTENLRQARASSTHLAHHPCDIGGVSSAASPDDPDAAAAISPSSTPLKEVQHVPSKSTSLDTFFVGKDSSRERAPKPLRNRSAAATASLIGPWKCPRCTFENIQRTWPNAKCEVCDADRKSAKEIIDVSY